MNEVFREFLHRSVIVYNDDILNYSRNLADHRHHVAQVLQKLRQFHLYLKLEKCEFHRPTVQFLGYIIGEEGIQMDQGKVTVKELQRFLGFANFYRSFIKGFSLLTAPLTTLLRGKPKSLSWSSSTHEAFEGLKTAFSTAPILRHPDPHVPFVVEVDASTMGVGAVLSQQYGEPPRLQPCAYFSKKLTAAEQNYDIKLALEEWRHWLERANHPFSVITDHKNLQYLREAKRLNPRQARWALFFLPGLTSPLPTVQETVIARLALYPVYTRLILLRTLSQFSLQPSLSTPLSGTSTRTSEPPLSPSLLRWEAQRGRLSFHLPNGNPFWAQYTTYRALDFQAANGPSRSSKLGTGGQYVPWYHQVRPQWASSYLSPSLVDPGHTWELILWLTSLTPREIPAS